jgi:uncharacterized protein (DUF305 family)
MFEKKYRIAAISAATLTAALVLSGCTSTQSGSNTNMMGSSQNASAFSGTDIMFAQMMIPHHQQAVEMAQLAKKNTTNPEVLALADQIEKAQAPEIEQMTKWIKSSGASMDMGHDMPMDGMLTSERMSALSAATGPAFDTLFLQGMIAHHQGAIAMADLIAQSTNPEAKKLAEAIVTGQTAEIATMQKLLGQ